MIGLYVAELLVIAAAVAATLWLRRAGDQAWAVRQHAAAMARAAKVRTVRVTINADTEPFQRAMARAAEQMARAFERMLPRRPCDDYRPYTGPTTGNVYLRCVWCHGVTCGDADQTDPCIEPYHHRVPHRTRMGKSWPIGGNRP